MKSIHQVDMKSKNASPVLADPAPLTKSRLGISSNLIPGLPSMNSVAPSLSDSLFFPSNQKKPKPSKLEDVRASGWLDAMKSSSPTYRDPNKDANHAKVQGGLDTAYHSWTLLYPSALESFENIVMSARGKRIALFLDYDGTLSPIVDDPDCAFISDMMRSVVSDVAKYFPTAIISGRCRDKVYRFVGLAELYYAGSHGMDIMGPKLAENCVTPADEQVFESLTECMEGIDGVKIENNKFCVSVHYRCANEENWDNIGKQVCDILQHYPQLQLCHGRKVLEIRPIIKWDKGKALEFLLDSLGLANCSDVLPIYIGDDRTDEDAFKVLQDKGDGYGILVSAVPKETCACYSLRDPSEVMGFLQRLIEWKKSCDINNSCS